MVTDDLPDSRTPADGAAIQNPTSAHGGLWKVGIATAVVAGLALAYVGGWWFGTKRNTRFARSSDDESSSERGRREEGGSSDAHGKVQLWEGGPYWAETNIGAEKPEDYGYYFWWGDTKGYKWDGKAWVTSDGSSRSFSFGSKNTPTYYKSIYTRIDELKSEEWITKDGVLAPKYDAAHVHWGGGWRMPTDCELRALEEKCDWTWTTKKGVEGYIVRGKGRYASASIFLPCAGYGYETSLYFAGSYGYYWSSVPGSDDYYSWGLDFVSSYHSTDDNGRDYGQSIRPVQGFIQKRTK